MKKEAIILERLGTITLLGWSQAVIKIGICTGFFYLIGLFNSIQDCILLSVSLFATENFHTQNLIQEHYVQQPNMTSLQKKKLQKQLTFFHAESLFKNTFLIILSYSFHPFAIHNYMRAHSIIFRLFANVFFSILIGMSWAFLASYSLKQSYRGVAT